MNEFMTDRDTPPVSPKPFSIDMENGEKRWFIDGPDGEPIEIANEFTTLPEEKTSTEYVPSSRTDSTVVEEDTIDAVFPEEEEPVYPITGSQATPPFPSPGPMPRQHGATDYDTDDTEYEAPRKKSNLRKCLAGIALGSTAALATAPYLGNAIPTYIMTERNVQVGYGEHFVDMIEHYVNKGEQE